MSVLRAFGAGATAVGRLLVGAVVALVVPAALIGIVLERLVLGPALARLAASYVTLSLRRDRNRDRRSSSPGLRSRGSSRSCG